MTPIAATAARALLAAFPVSYVVIGSFAAHLRGECELANVQDLDILVPFDREKIESLLCYLEKCGFDLRIWDQPIPRPITPSPLAEKYYVRATCGSLRVDVTFDLAHLPFAPTRAAAIQRDGICVCAVTTPRSSSNA